MLHFYDFNSYFQDQSTDWEALIKEELLNDVSKHLAHVVVALIATGRTPTKSVNLTDLKGAIAEASPVGMEGVDMILSWSPTLSTFDSSMFTPCYRQDWFDSNPLWTMTPGGEGSLLAWLKKVDAEIEENAPLHGLSDEEVAQHAEKFDKLFQAGPTVMTSVQKALVVMLVESTKMGNPMAQMSLAKYLQLSQTKAVLRRLGRVGDTFLRTVVSARDPLLSLDIRDPQVESCLNIAFTGAIHQEADRKNKMENQPSTPVSSDTPQSEISVMKTHLREHFQRGLETHKHLHYSELHAALKIIRDVAEGQGDGNARMHLDENKMSLRAFKPMTSSSKVERYRLAEHLKKTLLCLFSGRVDVLYKEEQDQLLIDFYVELNPEFDVYLDSPCDQEEEFSKALLRHLKMTFEKALQNEIESTTRVVREVVEHILQRTKVVDNQNTSVRMEHGGTWSMSGGGTMTVSCVDHTAVENLIWQLRQFSDSQLVVGASSIPSREAGNPPTIQYSFQYNPA